MTNKKKPVLLVNASHNFPLRNRCKYCSSNKLAYFQDYSNAYWYPNTRYARDRTSKEMTMSWVESTNFDLQSGHLFRDDLRKGTHSVAFKRYNPKLARNWGIDRYHTLHMVVVVICNNCKREAWIYRNSSIARLPENAHRKARINCPKPIMPLKWW